MARPPLRLPHAGGKPGLHHRRGALAGHRHRRELRHLLVRRCAAAASASGRASRRGLYDRLAIVVRGVQRQLAGFVVPRLRGHSRSQHELRRPRGVLESHRRVCERSGGDTQAHAGDDGQQQSDPADGCRTHNRPRVQGRRRSGPRPRRRRRARPDAVGTGIRVGRRRPGSQRTDQRRAVHGHRRGARVVHRHESGRALGFLRAADDVAARDQRQEDGLARGARREKPAGERTAQARHHAGAGAGRADGDRGRPRARLSGDEQEPAVLRENRVAVARRGGSA